MSNAFQEYVTGQAFVLTLSRRMCEAIEFCVRQEIHSEGFRIVTHIPNFPSMRALKERGLVDGGKLTEAGALVYPLLVHAGLAKSRDQLTAEMASRLPAQNGEVTK